MNQSINHIIFWDQSKKLRDCYISLNSQVTTKHNLKKSTVQPQIKSGNSKNMFKEKSVWKSEAIPV